MAEMLRPLSMWQFNYCEFKLIICEKLIQSHYLNDYDA